MTHSITLATALSLCAGLVIEAFFQLVKYRDALNSEGPRPVTAYGNLVDASNYMSVSQYLSGGHRKWVSYFLFRLLPLLIIFILLAGVLRRYLNIEDPMVYIIIAAITSLLNRDLIQFFRTAFISEKLLHVTNIISVMLVAFVVACISSIYDVSFIAPSLSGLIDNMWSSLLIALLVLFYLKATNMSTKHQDEVAQETAISNYVVRSYNEIKAKFSDVIDNSCQEYACSRQVLYSVLIYENMNRPAWLRSIENTIVRLPRIKMTVGIAQVLSDKPLTDKESIKRAAAILAGSTYADSGDGDGFANINQLETTLKDYNSGRTYAKSISTIIVKLRFYASEIFGGKG